jgi:hypothetical protein
LWLASYSGGEGIIAATRYKENCAIKMIFLHGNAFVGPFKEYSAAY